MTTNMITYAFIVHSRYREDLSKKFSSLHILPNFIVDIIAKILPPIVVSHITGLRNKSNEDVRGIIIGVPMTARQLLENRTLARKRILQAVKLAKKKGCTFIGLGAMTSSLTNGGKLIINEIPGVFVTTGRTYTVMNITSYVEYCIKRFNLDRKEVIIGIVGAAGGIGLNTAIALAKMGFRHFILIDVERKLNNLKKHIEIIERNDNVTTVEISHKVSDVGNCNIIIAATSAPEVVIKSSDVNPGTIIINDAQPSDISPDIVRERSDVIVIEGGVLNAPGIDCHFDFGLSGRNNIFSCLAETIILAHRSDSAHYSIDYIDGHFIDSMKKDAKALGFDITLLQNELGFIHDSQLNEFIKNLKVKSS